MVLSRYVKGVHVFQVKEYERCTLTVNLGTSGWSSQKKKTLCNVTPLHGPGNNNNIKTTFLCLIIYQLHLN